MLWLLMTFPLVLFASEVRAAGWEEALASNWYHLLIGLFGLGGGLWMLVNRVVLRRPPPRDEQPLPAYTPWLLGGVGLFWAVAGFPWTHAVPWTNWAEFFFGLTMIGYAFYIGFEGAKWRRRGSPRP